jgi:hypothetical protein
MAGNEVALMAAHRGGGEVRDLAVGQNQRRLRLSGQVAEAGAKLDHQGWHEGKTFAQKDDAFFYLPDILILFGQFLHAAAWCDTNSFEDREFLSVSFVRLRWLLTDEQLLSRRGAETLRRTKKFFSASLRLCAKKILQNK